VPLENILIEKRKRKKFSLSAHMKHFFLINSPTRHVTESVTGRYCILQWNLQNPFHQLFISCSHCTSWLPHDRPFNTITEIVFFCPCDLILYCQWLSPGIDTKSVCLVLKRNPSRSNIHNHDGIMWTDLGKRS
jgi:hypothetical protein